MLTYKAIYKFLEHGVHGEVLDFPGTISWGKNLKTTRDSLANALIDMAETNLLLGEALPQPNPFLKDDNADLEEPIYLILSATSQFKTVPVLGIS